MKEVALVTYIAEVKIPGDHTGKTQFPVSEIWIMHRGEWMCRYYQAALTK